MPEVERVKTCSCGQEIGFVGTKRGASAPVNIPAVRVYVWNESGWWEQLPGLVYVAHHSTCPDVDRYKKKEKK